MKHGESGTEIEVRERPADTQKKVWGERKEYMPRIKQELDRERWSEEREGERKREWGRRPESERVRQRA